MSREGCTRVSQCESDRIYSMTALPTGEVMTGGYNLHLYTLSEEGLVQRAKTFQNSNVIDEIVPLGSYKLITKDRKHCRWDSLKSWNYLLGSYETLRYSRIPSEE